MSKGGGSEEVDQQSLAVNVLSAAAGPCTLLYLCSTCSQEAVFNLQTSQVLLHPDSDAADDDGGVLGTTTLPSDGTLLCSLVPDDFLCFRFLCLLFISTSLPPPTGTGSLLSLLGFDFLSFRKAMCSSSTSADEGGLELLARPTLPPEKSSPLGVVRSKSGT